MCVTLIWLILRYEYPFIPPPPFNNVSWLAAFHSSPFKNYHSFPQGRSGLVGGPQLILLLYWGKFLKTACLNIDLWHFN